MKSHGFFACYDSPTSLSFSIKALFCSCTWLGIAAELQFSADPEQTHLFGDISGSLFDMLE